MQFEEAVEIVLDKEGGFQKNPKDKGNWTGGKVGVGILKGTKWGISAAAFPLLDIGGLTRNDAIRIYKTEYWNPIKPDWMPDHLRLSVFDCAVNSGVGRAIQFIQQIGGVKADGIFGPLTRGVIGKVTIENYNEKRLRFVMKSTTDQSFKEGISVRILKIALISLRYSLTN